MAYKHATEVPIPPSQLNPEIPPAVEAAILRALAKQRHLRYPHLSAFLEAMLSSSAPPRDIGMSPMETDSLQKTAPSSKSTQESDLSIQRRPKREHFLRLSRSQLGAMLLGTILSGSFIILSQKSFHISVSVGAWVYQPMIPIGSICVWCFLLTLASFSGARFGSLVGLVVGGAGFFLGSYISHITAANDSISLWRYISFYYLGNQSLDATPGYPILTSYFNLSLAAVGFGAGIAFLKTSGRYFSRRSFMLAEACGLLSTGIAGIAIFLVLGAWRGFPQGALFASLSLKFWLSALPVLLLLPCLLAAGNIIEGRYRRVIERREGTLPS